ncbi:hypothetical protein DdX_22291 [Ditylenchus destructor]|uniref:Uncharacterized protein n=1 Tax=Ditylenchus destructor TaxID=166010 RepID=A0AAD4MFZ8_9BILA|nr:hypothetical protein DdX_22291 [Ditylenchus destructor]
MVTEFVGEREVALERVVALAKVARECDIFPPDTEGERTGGGIGLDHVHAPLGNGAFDLRPAQQPRAEAAMGDQVIGEEGKRPHGPDRGNHRQPIERRGLNRNRGGRCRRLRDGDRIDHIIGDDLARRGDRGLGACPPALGNGGRARRSTGSAQSA